MAKKTLPPLHLDFIRHLDKRANIPTEELAVAMMFYLYDINNYSIITRNH